MEVARSGGSEEEEVFRLTFPSATMASTSSSFAVAVTSTTLALSGGGIAPRATSHDVRLAAMRLLGADEVVVEEDEDEDEEEEEEGDADGG